MPNNTGPMTKDNMVELKPCPFCGGDEISHGYNDPPPAPDLYGIVQCHSCDAFMLGEYPIKAIAAWNTRATMHGSDSGVTVDNEAEALERFAEYFRRNYPGPNTIIGNPDWHAPKIFRAALHAMSSASAPDSGALREALVEARAYVSAHHLPGEIFETELLAKIDAALANTDLSGER